MSTVNRRPSTDRQTSPALWAPSPNLGEGALQTPQSPCDSSPNLGEQRTNLLCHCVTSPPNLGGVWLWVESVACAIPNALPLLP